MGYGSGNLNADASVNSTDLGLLLNNFGFDSPATAAAATSVFVSAAATSADISEDTSEDLGAESETADASLAPFAAPAEATTAAADANSIRDLVFGELGDDDEDSTDSVI